MPMSSDSPRQPRPRIAFRRTENDDRAWGIAPAPRARRSRGAPDRAGSGLRVRARGTSQMTNSALLERIQSRQATVGVIGLGYVGLPLAVEFALGGFSVTGFDVDSAKVADIN